MYVGRPIKSNKYWIKYAKSRDRNKSNTMILFFFSIFNYFQLSALPLFTLLRGPCAVVVVVTVAALVSVVAVVV